MAEPLVPVLKRCGWSVDGLKDGGLQQVAACGAVAVVELKNKTMKDDACADHREAMYQEILQYGAPVFEKRL